MFASKLLKMSIVRALFAPTAASSCCLMVTRWSHGNHWVQSNCREYARNAAFVFGVKTPSVWCLKGVTEEPPCVSAARRDPMPPSILVFKAPHNSNIFTDKRPCSKWKGLAHPHRRRIGICPELSKWIAIEMCANSSTQFGTNSNSSLVWIPLKPKQLSCVSNWTVFLSLFFSQKQIPSALFAVSSTNHKGSWCPRSCPVVTWPAWVVFVRFTVWQEKMDARRWSALSAELTTKCQRRCGCLPHPFVSICDEYESVLNHTKEYPRTSNTWLQRGYKQLPIHPLFGGYLFWQLHRPLCWTVFVDLRYFSTQRYLLVCLGHCQNFQENNVGIKHYLGESPNLASACKNCLCCSGPIIEITSAWLPIPLANYTLPPILFTLVSLENSWPNNPEKTMECIVGPPSLQNDSGGRDSCVPLFPIHDEPLLRQMKRLTYFRYGSGSQAQNRTPEVTCHPEREPRDRAEVHRPRGQNNTNSPGVVLSPVMLRIEITDREEEAPGRTAPRNETRVSDPVTVISLLMSINTAWGTQTQHTCILSAARLGVQSTSCYQQLSTTLQLQQDPIKPIVSSCLWDI